MLHILNQVNDIRSHNKLIVIIFVKLLYFCYVIMVTDPEKSEQIRLLSKLYAPPPPPPPHTHQEGQGDGMSHDDGSDDDGSDDLGDDEDDGSGDDGDGDLYW